MDPNLHNFLLSYIYNLNEDNITKLIESEHIKKTKKLTHQSKTSLAENLQQSNAANVNAAAGYITVNANANAAANAAANSAAANANNIVVSEDKCVDIFYECLDVMVDIYGLNTDPEVPKTYQYYNLFVILNNNIKIYHKHLKLITEKKIYLLDCHGNFENQFTQANRQTFKVPNNMVIIFLTPINHYAQLVYPDKHKRYHNFLGTLKFIDSNIIGCINNLNEFQYSEILLPEQICFDMDISYNKSDKMNLSSLQDNKIIKHLPQEYDSTLSKLILGSTFAANTFNYVFISTCRSINDYIIDRQRNMPQLNQNTLEFFKKTGNEMYIYYNFIYYYNFNILDCVKTKLDKVNIHYQSVSKHMKSKKYFRQISPVIAQNEPVIAQNEPVIAQNETLKNFTPFHSNLSSYNNINNNNINNNNITGINHAGNINFAKLLKKNIIHIYNTKITSLNADVKNYLKTLVKSNNIPKELSIQKELNELSKLSNIQKGLSEESEESKESKELLTQLNEYYYNVLNYPYDLITQSDIKLNLNTESPSIDKNKKIQKNILKSYLYSILKKVLDSKYISKKITKPFRNKTRKFLGKLGKLNIDTSIHFASNPLKNNSIQQNMRRVIQSTPIYQMLLANPIK